MNFLFGLALSASAALAPLLQAHDWIGHRPDSQTTAGKVVVVDVFTYSCGNCQNVVPELRRLRREYGSGDLAIFGVHTPELPSDRVRSNVVQGLNDQGITWPVAIDNDGALWNAFHVSAWPTQLIFDRRGILRKTIVGDSQDQVVEAEVRALVDER